MTNTSQLLSPSSANLQPLSTTNPTYEIFDRYADSVIGCFATHYDVIEVHGVRDLATGSECGTCYEVDNTAPTSYSVYARLKEGGLDCIGDFSSSEDAIQYGAEVGAEYGWPVCNYVLAKHKESSQTPLQ